jgi:hypothetical protein
MFRRPIITLAYFLLAATFVISPMLASTALADPRDFMFQNGSSNAIDEAYVARSESTSWGSNVLSSPIQPGESRGIIFEGDLSTCVYDVHVTFDDGSTAALSNLDLCDTVSVTLDDSYITAR